MIPVALQPEPATFDTRVRIPGRAWLKEHKIPLNKKLPPKTEIKPCWRDCLDDLYSSYGGVCAYLCIFFERCSGAGSVDHYVPKSRRAGLAYEWDNYRLACSQMNTCKRDYEDVLDPLVLANETFHLELVTGHIYPSPALAGAHKVAAQETLDRLGLDEPWPRGARVRHLDNFLVHKYPEHYLKSYSPFVWYEAQRQGLL